MLLSVDPGALSMLLLDRYAPAVPYTVAMSLGPGCFPKVGKK